MNLTNIWRHMHLNDRAYTLNNKDTSSPSHIDFWLILSDLEIIQYSVITELTAYAIRQT